MSNPENLDNSYNERAKDILERAFGEHAEGKDVPEEPSIGDGSKKDGGKEKPGYQMSKKQLAEIFSEKELKNLKAVKISSESGDVGGAEDEPDQAQVLKDSLTPRHFNELQFIKKLADPQQLNKLGEVEASGELEYLPSREDLEKSMLQEGALDDEPSRIIEAVARGRAEGLTGEIVVKLLENYKNIKPIEREVAISLLKKYTPEELKERSDFVKSIGEVLVNGALPMNKDSLRIRQSIIETLGSSKSAYAVDILAHYAEFIRTNEYVVSQDKGMYADIYKSHDYIALINALKHLEKDLESEEQQERYIELIEILRDQLLDYLQETEIKITGWKTQNPELSDVQKNIEDLSDKDYETNSPIRAEILGWKDAYSGLDEEEKKFFISNFRQMADGSVIAEEILQCMKEDPTDPSLRQLYNNFSRTLGEVQVERLGKILLNNSVAFDPENGNAKKELIQLIVHVASPSSLEAIREFSEKVSNYEYTQNEDDLDNPPELLRKKDQELILWAATELEQNMGGVDDVELAKLRDEAQNNLEDASQEYEKWKKNHPQHAV